MKHLTFTLATLLAPGLALAQASAPAVQAPAPATAPAPPEAPKPAPETKAFEFLVGEWIHDETWTAAAAGAAGKAKGISRAQWILGDHVLQITYKANTSMLGIVEARGFPRYDGEKKVYVFDWMTNRGAAIHMEGVLDGRAIVLQGERVLRGQPRKEKLTLTPQEDGSVVQKTEVAGADGTFVPAVEGKITPKPKAAEAPKQ
jgi:hypothetical protein